VRVLLHNLAVLAVVMAAGCASQLEPAKDMLGDVSTAMAEVSGEAAQAVPEQFAEVQREVAELQAHFDHEDYAAVIAEGPAVLIAVHQLGSATAAKKAALMQSLNGAWAQRANQLPEQFAAIERRLEFLNSPANRKTAAGIDVEAARTAVRDAVSLWSKGQAAYADGNLQEAVQTADAVQVQADTIKSAIRLR
jgi:hypothetical protein